MSQKTEPSIAEIEALLDAFATEAVSDSPGRECRNALMEYVAAVRAEVARLRELAHTVDCPDCGVGGVPEGVPCELCNSTGLLDSARVLEWRTSDQHKRLRAENQRLRDALEGMICEIVPSEANVDRAQAALAPAEQELDLTKEPLCQKCDGSGREIVYCPSPTEFKCPRCNGTGRETKHV